MVIGALDLDDDQSAIYTLDMTSRETKPVFEMQVDKSKIKDYILILLTILILGFLMFAHQSRNFISC